MKAFWVEQDNDEFFVVEQQPGGETKTAAGPFPKADYAWNRAAQLAAGGEYTTLPAWATPTDEHIGPRACWLVGRN